MLTNLKIENGLWNLNQKPKIHFTRVSHPLITGRSFTDPRGNEIRIIKFYLLVQGQLVTYHRSLTQVGYQHIQELTALRHGILYVHEFSTYDRTFHIAKCLGAIDFGPKDGY